MSNFIDDLLFDIAMRNWNTLFKNECIRHKPVLAKNKPEDAMNHDLAIGLLKRAIDPLKAARMYLNAQYGMQIAEDEGFVPDSHTIEATFGVFHEFFLMGCVEKAPQLEGMRVDNTEIRALFDKGLEVPAAVEEFLNTKAPGWETGAVPENFSSTAPSLDKLFETDQLEETRPGCICGMCAPDETGSVPRSDDQMKSLSSLMLLAALLTPRR